MNLVDYWKKRCELAEVYIEQSPCCPDIYKEQLDAWNNWCEFKKLPIPVVVGQSEQLVCRDCEKPSKEYRDQLCEPCHKWHTDS